jgi:hypothetical protein
LPRPVSDALQWLTTKGLVVAAVLFGVLKLAHDWNIPSQTFWTDTADWSIPILFGLGAYTLIVGPIKTFLLSGENRRLKQEKRVEETCHQLVLTIRASAATVPLESLAAHAWRVDGDTLVRLPGFRVQPRPDSGVVWSKAKGALGQCWRENVEIEADLANIHSAAAIGRAAFEDIPIEGRFFLEWDEYRKTDRYWAIFATPLRDKGGTFIGCVSIDCTHEGVAPRFFAACRGSLVGGLIRVLEDAVRES